MKPLYIFDLDGTLALVDHRRHLVEYRDCPQCHGCGEAPGVPECRDCGATGRLKPDWPAFFAACARDEPNTPVVDTLLRLLDTDCDVWIWSGRSSEVMEQTNVWLADHLGDAAHGLPLCMRVEGDFTPDDQLKESWLHGMRAHDRRRLVAVFDDRQKVVDMWRRNGVACFQVAPGEF